MEGRHLRNVSRRRPLAESDKLPRGQRWEAGLIYKKNLEVGGTIKHAEMWQTLNMSLWGQRSPYKTYNNIRAPRFQVRPPLGHKKLLPQCYSTVTPYSKLRIIAESLQLTSRWFLIISDRISDRSAIVLTWAIENQVHNRKRSKCIYNRQNW